MNKNRTTIILSLSIIVMIVSILTFTFFFKVIQDKNEHTSTTLITLANKMAKKENIKMLKDKIDEVEATKESTNKHFVDSTQIDSFIDYLEGLGSSSGTQVKVENFEVSPENKNILSIKLLTKGSFSNVMRMISLLENTQYQIKISKTSIQKQPEVSNIDEKTGRIISSGISIWIGEISFIILVS